MANSILHTLSIPIKNARFSFQVSFRNSSGVPTDPTTPDTEISVDGGATFSDTTEEITTGGSNGIGYVTLTGSEMNNSLVAIACKSANCTTTPVLIRPHNLAIVATGTLSAGSSGGGTLGTLLAYDITGCYIRTTGGTGGGGTGGANNQARRIITYNTSTGAFTVGTNWETTPDNTTTYDILLPPDVTLGMLRSLNPATPGRTVVVDSSGLVDANAVKVGPSGSGTSQTAGDIIGRLGNPTGASLAADVAAVQTTCTNNGTSITNLTNLSAKCNWFGSTLLEIPSTSTRAYYFEMVVKDDEDKLVNLDSLPTITLVNPSGTDRSSLISTSVYSVATGRYAIVMSIPYNATSEALTLRGTGAISGESRMAVLGLQVVDYDVGTSIQTILAGVNLLAGNLTDDGRLSAVVRGSTYYNSGSDTWTDRVFSNADALNFYNLFYNAGVPTDTTLTYLQSINSLTRLNTPVVTVVVGRSNTILFPLFNYLGTYTRVDWGWDSGLPYLRLRKTGVGVVNLTNSPSYDTVTGTNRLTLTSTEVDLIAAGYELEYQGGNNGPYSGWVSGGSLYGEKWVSYNPIVRFNVVDPSEFGGGSGISDQLDAIQAKTDLIQSGRVVTSSPVTDTGVIDEPIVIGDDYRDANGRAFVWTVDPVDGMTASQCTCWFGGSSDGKGSWLVEGDVTVVGDTWELSFDLLRTDTESCNKGQYEWSVAVHDSDGNEVTRVRSGSHKVQLVEKQT